MSALAALLLAAAASPTPGGEAPPPKDFSLLLMVLGLLMVAFTLGRALRRRRALAVRASEDALETVRRGAPARGETPGRVQETCEEMAASLARTAREVNAQLDTKIQTLEVLIRQADERIAALGGPAASASSPEKTHADDPRHAPVYSLADEGLSAIEIAQRTGLGQGDVEFILNLRDGGTSG